MTVGCSGTIGDGDGMSGLNAPDVVFAWTFGSGIIGTSTLTLGGANDGVGGVLGDVKNGGVPPGSDALACRTPSGPAMTGCVNRDGLAAVRFVWVWLAGKMKFDG